MHAAGLSELEVGNVQSLVSEAEWQARCELAATHWLVSKFVFVDMTYNHVSVRVPGEPNHFLVKADNLFMEQVTASNLVKYDTEGNQVLESKYKASPAAYNLHAAVLRTRPEIMAAVHTHSPANLAVSAQKKGLMALTQQAARFYKRIAYYANEYDDTTYDGASMLAKTLGDHWVMLLQNHGALVCGSSLAEAYIYHHFFELACRAQIGALSGGGEVVEIDDKAATARAERFGRIGQYNSMSRDWQASMALVEKSYPEYKT